LLEANAIQELAIQCRTNNATLRQAYSGRSYGILTIAQAILFGKT